MRLKKITFIIVFTILFIYFSGFFSRPTIEYWIYIGLPENVSEIKDIKINLPYPYYCGKPIPLYKGTYIKEIFPAIKTAGKTKNAKIKIIKDKKYGKILNINIKRLTKTDNKLEIYFSDNTIIPNFFTPLVFFKELQKIYFLNPISQKWHWKKTKQGFEAKKKTTVWLYQEFFGESIDIGLNFKFKKKFFFGYILVHQSLGKKLSKTKNNIAQQGWIKYNITEQDEIKLY